MSIKKVAEGLIRRGADVTDGILNRIEMAFRAYDPCFGCATHALTGQMPMEIVIRGLDGSVRETIRPVLLIGAPGKGGSPCPRERVRIAGARAGSR